MYPENVLLHLCPLDASDEPEKEVHDSRGAHVLEQEAAEAGLGLDVLNHLEAGVLVAVPVLNNKISI